MSEVKKAIELLRNPSAENSAELLERLGPQRVTALHKALREPTPMENMATYLNVGWCSTEVELLQKELKPGETVARFDTWSATTNRRVIDRAKLRADARPCAWSRVETWLAQFPAIPDRGGYR